MSLPLAQALREATARFEAAGIAGARVDAELLAAHVLRLGRGELAAAAIRGATLDGDTATAYEALVSRRAAREPLQHLTGSAPFRRIELLVGPGVFVPRPETEGLAGLAIEEARSLALASTPSGPLVVDLCTGSGAVALSVADEVPSATVVAVELEPDAVGWARRNVAASPARDRVDLRAGDAVDAHLAVCADLAGRVDVVVANPPYIPPGATPVDPEVARHDPRAALYGGGDDGLEIPRGVVRAAAGLLRPGGLFLMEHADVQAAATRALVAGEPWSTARTVQDAAGRDRVLVVRRRPSRA